MNQKTTLQQIAREAMRAKGFLTGFTEEQIRFAEQAETKTGQAAVRDLKHLPWCSIDNDDSEDLDQLTVSMPGEQNAIKILIAIADVDSIVNKQSVWEAHASHNTTSVYTPALIFPMLPEKLSTDLTSLRFNSERPAVIVEFSVAADGSIGNSTIYQAIVHNQAKLTYNGIGNWLQGGVLPNAAASVPDLEKNLRLQDEAADKLRKRRYEQGALYLETTEANPVFEGDEVKEIRESKSNEAKSLIQEFMIAANGVVSGFLVSSKFPSIQRVVRSPKRWDRIVALAAERNYRLGTEPDPKALDEFLIKARTDNPERFPELSLSVLKLLGSGEYVVESPGDSPGGHFGLAVKNYTHSTAPNRRYPDLVTQRLLKAALSGKPFPYTIDELKQIAMHCTTMEDAAKKVERQVEKSTAALYFGTKLGNQFDAIVTGASDKGTWVRILHYPVDGKLVDGYKGLDVGDKLRVELVHTDVQRGFIDFKKIN